MKEMDDDTPLVIIEYSFFGRALALFFRLFGVYIGAFIIVADQYLFLNILGWLIFVPMMFRSIEMLLFDKALLTHKYYIKKWYFLGQMKLDIQKLQCKKSSNKFGGSLLFDEKGSIGQSLFFSLDRLPLDTEKMGEIKAVLIELGVISEDDCSWIDSKPQSE